MRGSSKRTAAWAGTQGGGEIGDTKLDGFISHVSTENASHITQDKAFSSKGIKQDAPLTALLKRAIAVAEREDQTIADLASLALRYADVMHRGGGKEITLQGWPCGSWWLVIRDADGSGSRLEYRGAFADAYRLALLFAVYGDDATRGAPIIIAGCCDE